MSKAIALGCGLVGQFVVERLLEHGHEVTVVDLQIPEELSTNPKVNALVGDVEQHLENFPPKSVVINMLPGRVGDKVRPQLLTAGHNVVDLAFTAEDPHVHEQLAVENNAVLLWDVGIAPGMSNMLAKKGFEELGHLDTLTIKVGGNPTTPDSRWSYMAPFSPSDVIEEYTRPVRIKSNNDYFEVPAITDRHIIQVDGYGEMEAFLTDGLRSVLTTISASNMKEYTVRWPGHIQKWLDSRGILDESEILDAWKFDPSREEFTWLEVVTKTAHEQKRWVVHDSGLDGDGSMARTTGLVTAACALMFLRDGPLKGCGLAPGIHPPEALTSEAIDFVIEMLVQNGVQMNED
ncbi:MAG: hypothetical protein DWC09_01925 [Candidatus Poseidoniales archaeon]|nr:MAG: hypothetical protein DWC09_01925 [Candidatus Poseidoniales archaeon]